MTEKVETKTTGVEFFVYDRDDVPGFKPIGLRFNRDTVTVERWVDGAWEPDLADHFLKKVLLGDVWLNEADEATVSAL